MAFENRHRRLSEQVVEEVRRLIITGAYPPNTQLSEVELSEQLGVSRTPVREAFIRLAEDGLVNILPQIGSFVAPISIEAVQQAQFIREHLECALIVELARCSDRKIVQQLRRIVKQQAIAARHKDWDAFYALDEELHATFATASGHPAVWRVIQQSKTHIDRVRYVGNRQPEHAKVLLAQHTAIVDAIARGDADEAQSLMRTHLREVFETIRELGIDQQAETPTPPQGNRVNRVIRKRIPQVARPANLDQLNSGRAMESQTPELEML
jgi:DNA-binding GntR family transcriptional regulator